MGEVYLNFLLLAVSWLSPSNQGSAGSNQKSWFPGHTDGVDRSFSQYDNNKDFVILNFGQIRKFKIGKYDLRVLIWVKARPLGSNVPGFVVLSSITIKKIKETFKIKWNKKLIFDPESSQQTVVENNAKQKTERLHLKVGNLTFDSIQDNPASNWSHHFVFCCSCLCWFHRFYLTCLVGFITQCTNKKTNVKQQAISNFAILAF